MTVALWLYFSNVTARQLAVTGVLRQKRGLREMACTVFGRVRPVFIESKHVNTENTPFDAGRLSAERIPQIETLKDYAVCDVYTELSVGDAVPSAFLLHTLC